MRWYLAALLFVACDATKPDEGNDASLHVIGGQFFRGAFPAPAGGPAVTQLSVSPKARAGVVDHNCGGTLEPAATGVAIALAGDIGYWIVPAGVPDVNASAFPTFAAELAFAQDLPTGTRDLVAAASDAAGHFGAPTAKPIAITGFGPPGGALVFSLSWENGADLDLHVVAPNGVEVFDRNISSYQAPGAGSPPEAPGTPHDGGLLDFDSNGQCVEDGRRMEDVVWKDAPPPGHYIARVATASLCGEVNAHWKLRVLRDGVLIGAAAGAVGENDTRFPDDYGGGVLAVEVDVP